MLGASFRPQSFLRGYSDEKHGLRRFLDRGLREAKLVIKFWGLYVGIGFSGARATVRFF